MDDVDPASTVETEPENSFKLLYNFNHFEIGLKNSQTIVIMRNKTNFYEYYVADLKTLKDINHYFSSYSTDGLFI